MIAGSNVQVMFYSDRSSAGFRCDTISFQPSVLRWQSEATHQWEQQWKLCTCTHGLPQSVYNCMQQLTCM